MDPNQTDDGADKEKSEANSEHAQSATDQPNSSSDSHLRQNLVELAVKFLNNSRVQDSPMEQKKAFLKKKGLPLAAMSSFEGTQ